MRELEALRALVADLDALWRGSAVGTVPATEVADAFEQHTASLPPESKLLEQLGRLASMLRKGPTRTRVEAIRQIVRKLQLQADEFAHVLEARDSKLRDKR
jgi:DNA-binding transcriptional regulator YiaG